MRAETRLPLILGALLLAWGLLLAHIPTMSLWIDEAFTLRNAGQPTLGAVIAQTAATERRPPLSFLLFHGWFTAFPTDEFAWRWLPAAWALLAVAAGSALAARVAPQSAARAALLLAASPFLQLYGPMLRAYSLTLLLGLLLTLLVLRRQPRAYLALAIVGIWIDYVIWALIAAHAIWLLWPGARRATRGWLVVLALGGAAALPLLADVLAQSGRDLIAADLATSPLGVALKLAYPLYASLLGETLFPWSPWAWLGLGGAGLAFAGLLRRTRPALPGGTLGLLALSAALPLLAIVALLTLVATDLPFVNVPSRAIVAPPLLLLLVAVGLGRQPPRLAALALTALLVADGAALVNLLRGADFINPIYAVPTRAIAAQIAASAQPGAAVVADRDTVLDLYLTALPVVTTDDPAATAALIPPPPELWLLTFGRDRTRQLAPDAPVRAALAAAGWQQRDRWPFVTQNPTYRRLKQRLFGRDAYDAKATLERWVPAPRQSHHPRPPDRSHP